MNTLSPTQTVLTRLSTLLGADTVTFAGAVSVFLLKVPFAPSPQLTFVADDEADFDGYAIITRTAATRPTAFDPFTGDRLVTVTPPAGGWLWETTGATDLPQTIYGWGLGADTAGIGGTLLGAALFPAPVVLTDTDQQVTVPEVIAKILAGAMG